MFCFSSTAAGQGRHETIATTGDLAPGGGAFGPIRDIQFNAAGQVAFESYNMTLTSSLTNTGLFYYNGSSLSEIARENGTAPGNSGGRFNAFDDLQLNDFGQVAFESNAMRSTSGLTDAGIFFHNGSTVTEIARKGDAAPGTSGGNLGNLRDLRLHNAGQVVFQSDAMTGTGTGTDQGIFFHNGSSLSEIAREGGAAPGSSGGNFGGFSSVQLNDSGHVGFYSFFLIGSPSTDAGIFLHNGSTISEIARRGDAAPGPSVGNLGYFDSLQLNNTGEVVFESFAMTGTPSATDSGIFFHNGSSLSEIAREGGAAPGASGGNFGDFFQLQLNDKGHVTFQSAFMTGTSAATGSGIFLHNGSSLSEIVRKGDAAPGSSGGNFGVFANELQLNNEGHVVFQSSITGTSTATDDGIFISDGIETIEVRREGDLLGGSPIEGFDAVSINDFGQVAYLATLAGFVDSIQKWTPDLHWRPTFSSSWDTGGVWTLGINPAMVHDVFIDSDASVTVSGPDADTTIKSLQIGGGNGLATFKLRNGSTLTAVDGVTILATGRLTGDGSIAGNVNNQGTVLGSNVLVNSTLTNNGVIEGSGRVHANIVNNPVGQIRANNGALLQLTGPSLSNSGRIEVINGELQVTAALQNNASTGLITGRNATMRFDGGVNNDGSIGISVGTSDVFGDITNTATGTINVSGGAVATFYDDVIQNGTMQIVSVGNTNSAAVFFGELSGAGGFSGGGDVFALGDLRPGNSPASVLMDGSLFLGASTDTFVELGGLAIGEFDQLLVSGELSLAGDLSVSLIDGFQLTFNDEFLIADVGGALNGQFNALGEGDLVGNFGGMDLFITYGAGNGNDVGLFTAVPEPGTLVLCTAALMGLALVRQRRSFFLPRGEGGQRPNEVSRVLMERSTHGTGALDINPRQATLSAVLIAFTIMPVLLLAPTSVSAQGRHKTIATTGDPAPGASGGNFGDFSNLRFNNAGQVGFHSSSMTGTSSSTDRGIFFYDGSSLIEIARRGHPAPGTSGGDFGALNSLRLNDAGQLAFLSSFMTGTSGGGLDDDGAFFYNGSTLIEIAREGSPVPGPGVGNFGRMDLVVANNVGHVAIKSRIMTGPFSEEGIFFYNGSTLTEIARSGAGAPGPSGGIFALFGNTLLNDTGQVLFHSTKIGGTLDDEGIFLHNGNIVNEIAREGGAAPGSSGGNFDSFRDLNLNSSGQVVFVSYGLDGTSGGALDDEGIFLHNGNIVNEIAREGGAAPGSSGGNFGRLHAQLNDRGQVAVTTFSMSGTSAGTNEGIFFYNGTSLSEIVREGDAAPGAGNGNFGTFGDVDFNNNGQFLFTSNSMTGTPATTDNGIFISDGFDTIAVRREGDLIGATPITGFLDLSINDFAQVAYRAILTGGAQSVQRWTPDVSWRTSGSGEWDDKTNWTLSINPAMVHDTTIDPASSLTVNGPTGHTTVRSLTVGGGTGITTLNLQGGTIETVTNAPIRIESMGRLTGQGTLDPALSIHNYGTIDVDNLHVDGSIENFGVVEGNGRISVLGITNRQTIRGSLTIDGGIFNTAPAEVRVGSGERMLLGALINAGRTEVIGGELEVENSSSLPSSNSASTGLIVGRDATMRFNQGLTNNGALAFTFGTSDVFGDINNNATGVINIAGGANVTFYDDLTQNGTFEVMAVGNTSSSAVLFGWDGAGGFTGGGDVFVAGDLRPGNSPASVLMDGNLYLGSTADTFIELGGLQTGEFDQLLVTGELGLGGDLLVQLINGFNLTFNDEFLIADVGGVLNGEFNALGEGSLVGNYGGMDLFITYGAGDGNDVALFTAVAEPGPLAGCVFGAMAIAVVYRRRKKGKGTATVRERGNPRLRMTLRRFLTGAVLQGPRRTLARLGLFCVLALAVSLAEQTAKADLVYSPTAVIANTIGESHSSTVVEQMIDHSGLSIDFTSGVTDFDSYIPGPVHDSFTAFNSWIGNFNALPGHIDFDMGQSLDLTRMVLWNRDGTSGSVGGIKDFEVFVSNSPTFPGGGASAGSFSATTGVNDPSNSIAQVFDLTDLSGRYVRLSIDNIHVTGLQRPAIGEIAFGGTASVPEPGSCILGAIAIVGAAFAYRRRRMVQKRKNGRP